MGNIDKLLFLGHMGDYLRVTVSETLNLSQPPKQSTFGIVNISINLDGHFYPMCVDDVFWHGQNVKSEWPLWFN